MSTIIILSTVLIKQHAILDVFGGFLLVELVYLVLARIEIELNPALNKQNKIEEVYRG
jgi:membrane-associated phospholipid phosphatase